MERKIESSADLTEKEVKRIIEIWIDNVKQPRYGLLPNGGIDGLLDEVVTAYNEGRTYEIPSFKTVHGRPVLINVL